MTPLADGRDAAAMIGVGGDATVAPAALAVSKRTDGAAEARKLAESERITSAKTAREQARLSEAAAARAKAEEEAKRPKFVRPADGSFTSGFGARWGTTHYGVDIANRIGTPIKSVTDGVVIEAGPASGFGLWLQVQHADGTISVYGHIDSYSVRVGQKVKAGEQIARMGNRGQSTGPHLHFEIWDSSGKKVNPMPWLTARGIDL
ncbi:peptidase M23-like protein [Herbihabitans rhizosphaerae]|uniref:Peptidase M23-like protein n=1 Tax=Herbihabitans rhizosphaerae TaxID=1872711 RepID=A0A4Q7KL37_9PSEU|nr:peptidase M23-like protein [Herbihabitans rhizosphaerae]